MPIFSETLHRSHLHRTPVYQERRSFAEPVRTPSHEEVARLAYSYWEERGRRHGSALEDWLRAENELRKRYSR